ncbi:MAG: OmpP1/FadL family transporter [Ignavibacteriaceae bacterium]
MKHYLSVTIAAIFLFSLSLLNSTFATGGYFKHGYGTKYSSLAGAGVALSLSSMGAATNPAGLAFLDKSQYEINLGLFSPLRDYTVTGNPSGYPGTFGLTPGQVKSETNYFVIPSIAATWKLNETSAIGAMAYANGGMNTNYNTRTFYDPSSPSTGVSINQMFLGVTYANEFLPGNALGITALFGYQMFSAKGILSFAGFSSDPKNLSGNRNSTSTGFGLRVGYMGKILPYLSVGASYQTKMSMTKFKEYAGLFAQQGDFDIPANWTVGLAAKATEDLTFALDVQEIYYSGVKSVGNPFMPNLKTSQLGADNGAGFGWKDVTVVKFGVMYKTEGDLTWMAGYSYGTQPVPDSEVLFNILAPAVVQNHITAGFSKKLNSSNELSLSLMFAPATSVMGANPLEAPGQQTIKLNMTQWQLEIGYSFM